MSAAVIGAEAAPAQPQPQPLRGASLALLTLGLSLGTFIEVLDSTVANVAVPTIAGTLGVSNSQGTWVISSYAVAAAIVVPLTGWLARRFGEARLFTTSVLLFTLTSMLCGMAPTFHALVALRLAQGFVSGPMMSLSQTILLRNYPERQRGLAVSLWGALVIIAPIFGPVVGGWIIDTYSWPWIFYINLPIGLFSFFTCSLLLRGRDTPTRREPIDLFGIVLLIVGVGALQMMLDLGRDHGWFHSSFISTLAAIAFICLGFLLIWESGEKHPVLDLSVFRDRTFSASTLVICIGVINFSTVAVIFPLWLQTVMGYTAEKAGLATSPVGILAIVVSVILGRNINRVNLRLVASFGFLVFALVAFWNASFNLNLSFLQLVMPRLVQGIGVACFFIPLTTATLSNIPDDKLAAASGLSNFLRTLSAAFGTALSVTLWDNRATYHHAELARSISLFSDKSTHYLDALRAAGFSGGRDLAVVNQMVTQQAYMMATNDVFHLSGMLCLMLAALIWLAKPKPGAKGPLGH
ncbi:MAG: DHA2 family efflux MFS transporter permease subunit [Nevskia sp.]|nr:DHA2 family efflux MFS transporter permease subunit [Nevskia sp.]